jgi:hypothetical protein
LTVATLKSIDATTPQYSLTIYVSIVRASSVIRNYDVHCTPALQGRAY